MVPPAPHKLVARTGPLHHWAPDVHAGGQLLEEPEAGCVRPEIGVAELQAQRAAIDAHFGAASVGAIMESLGRDENPFAQKALKAMRQRSPLMMCVTREMLVRGASMSVADCLRMERSLVRRNFEHGEVLEGVRALVIDKDNAPQWNPASLEGVTPQMVEGFFAPVWPAYAHPLRHLD